MGHYMSNHLFPTLTLSDFFETLTKFDLTFCMGKSMILALSNNWKKFDIQAPICLKIENFVILAIFRL